jgi:hypothetical protein
MSRMELEPEGEPETDAAEVAVPDHTAFHLLTFWFFLAAFAQLGYLAQWPMDVIGTRVAPHGGLLVALVRLGVYSAIGYGLVHRQPDAWAGAVLELMRSFGVFFLMLWRSEWSLEGAVFPAPWMQGVLSGALPALLALNTAIAAGWRPGADLETGLESIARFLACASGLGSLWLSRQSPVFGVPEQRSWPVLLRDGLPLVGLVAAAEAAAVFLSF